MYKCVYVSHLAVPTPTNRPSSYMYCIWMYLRNSFSGQLPLNIYISADRVIEIYVMLSLYPVAYDVSSHCAVCPVRHFSNWPCVVFTKIWKRESPVSTVIYRYVSQAFVFSSFFLASFLLIPLHFGFGFIWMRVLYIAFESNTNLSLAHSL